MHSACTKSLFTAFREKPFMLEKNIFQNEHGPILFCYDDMTFVAVSILMSIYHQTRAFAFGLHLH